MWLLSVLTAAFVQGGGPPPPNVLVVLLDDVGRDKLHAYGVSPSAPPTPNLDALAARGVLFRNAWAYHACSPTRAALLTGRHADRTGIGSVIRSGDGVYSPLDLSETTLPEALPGYTSVALGKWHLRDLGDPDTHPLDSGFDAVSGYLGPNDYRCWSWNINGTLVPQTGYFPTELAGQAVETLRRVPEPYFVYYCPKMAHSPYHVPPAPLHTQGQPTTTWGKHAAMSESIDTIVGRVLSAVDLETTYVFVMGDNGSPGEAVVPPFMFNQAKGSVYEGGVRVPLIVAGPGVARGQECDELVHVTDLFATIRELSGLGPPTSGAEDSLSFAGQLTDPQQRGHRETLFVHKFPFPGLPGPDVRALRTRRWKIIHRAGAQRTELYDLIADPFELDDLLVSQPGPATAEIRDRLLALMPTFP